LKQIIWPVLLGILILSGCNSSEEKEARDTAEAYMEAVKNGDEFKEIYSVEEFIDVFDYKYLKTLEDNQEKRTSKTTYEDWKALYEKAPDIIQSTFKEYKENKIESLELDNKYTNKQYQVVKNTGSVLEYWDGESYTNNFVFLYNVEIANEEGQKLYKKAEIAVKQSYILNEETEEYEEGYIISDITLR
jgi:hypothetical protein